MEYNITHNRDDCTPTALGIMPRDEDMTIKEIPANASHVHIARRADGGINISAVHHIAAPAPIPMSDMPPRSYGVIVGVTGCLECDFINRVVYHLWNDLYISLDGSSFSPEYFTVRLLQEGESLLIERVADEPTPEPQAEPDGFERLADGTRIMCKNCNDSGKGCSPPVASMDPRGYKGCGHPCWKPKPPTLDDALRTCTAEEIVAAAKSVYELRDALIGKCGLVFRFAFDGLFERDTEADDDARDLAVAFVELRDRLDLFGEGK